MRLITSFTLVAMIVFSSFGKVDTTDNVKNIESYSQLTIKLNEAVEVRNFAAAREALQEIIPLMKEDIKSSKKTLHQLEKEENPAIPVKEYKKGYDRKVEIYDTLKHLIDLSAAALRVKSQLIVSNVKEYEGLMKVGFVEEL